MMLKDYYKTLELEPSATQAEIKKAYRRLAKQYHPDKTQNDTSASAIYQAIKEAYEVLTDPSKKEFYLQQRWYNQSVGRRKTQQLITPSDVLKQALELDRYVSRLDHFRMDKYGLRDYIKELMAEPVVKMLNDHNDRDINSEITRLVSKCLHILPVDAAESLYQELRKIHVTPETEIQLYSSVQLLKKQSKWDRYKMITIVLITLAICIAISCYLGS
jgi:curved DNA-binding protein CbpA